MGKELSSVRGVRPALVLSAQLPVGRDNQIHQPVIDTTETPTVNPPDTCGWMNMRQVCSHAYTHCSFTKTDKQAKEHKNEQQAEKKSCTWRHSALQQVWTHDRSGHAKRSEDRPPSGGDRKGNLRRVRARWRGRWRGGEDRGSEVYTQVGDGGVAYCIPERKETTVVVWCNVVWWKGGVMVKSCPKWQ